MVYFLNFLFLFAFAGSAAAAECTSAEVIVYGGTPSGISAAIQAAHMKKLVVLIEPTAHVGGIVTNGLTKADVSPHEHIIGGAARTFLTAMRNRYSQDVEPRDYYEAKGAESHFVDLLKLNMVSVYYGQTLLDVTLARKRITRLSTLEGGAFCGKVFIDASYEGDLLLKAGVETTIGRESMAHYHERDAGVRDYQEPAPELGASPLDISAYVSPGAPSSGLVLGVAEDPGTRFGAADKNLMAFNYRFCITNDPANRVLFEKPQGYRRSDYELQLRWIRASKAAGLPLAPTNFLGVSPTVMGENDVNTGSPFSTDITGKGYDYVTGTQAARRAIELSMRLYTQGFLYFISHEPEVPSAIRQGFAQYGLCKDEFVDNGNWPRQIYVREARRLVGAYVLTENEIQEQRPQPDSIGLGYYPLDSHVVQQVVINGRVFDEGGRSVPIAGPYQIPMRMLLPKRGSLENLVAAVDVSSSRTAYRSLRGEPTLMTLGQGAGAVAAAAIEEGVAVQDASYAKVKSALLEAGQILTYSP